MTLFADLPKLVRLYIVNVAIGFGLACLFTAMLIAFDVGHLRHLVMSAQGGWLAVVMMVMFNTVVFAGVQFSIAVMRLAEPEDGPRGGRRMRSAWTPGLAQRVLVPAAARKQRR